MVAAFTRQSKEVPSEESIRLMLAAHTDRLTNPLFIHEKSIPDFLQKVSARKERTHYQLFVEVSARSPLSQGVPDGIHYSAMDVYCHETGAIIVFIADHYQGKDYLSYRKIYDTMALENIKFIVAGGTSYQTDGKNCPIFTLQHLLLTAFDENLYRMLVEKASMSEGRMVQLPWFELDPIYNMNIQSFNQLSSYIDFVKQREQTPPEEESITLRAAEFDHRLSGRFQQLLNKKRQPIIINNNIESLAMDYACASFSYVESRSVGEAELIEICYREKYPFVANILREALEVSLLIDGRNETTPLSGTGDPRPYLSKHGLFDCIFSNQPFLDFLSTERMSAKKTKGQKKQNAYELLYLLLMNRPFLALIQQGYIDPPLFFKSITDTTDNKVCKLLEKKVELLHKHVKFGLFGQINRLLREHPEFNTSSEGILDLLFVKNIGVFFELESMTNLYFSGRFSNSDFERVRFNLLNIGSLREKTEEELLEALINASPTTITHGCLSPPVRDSVVEFDPMFFSGPDIGELEASAIIKPDLIRFEERLIEESNYKTYDPMFFSGAAIEEPQASEIIQPKLICSEETLIEESSYKKSY